MIANDNQLKVTLERIARFQEQVTHLRRVETNPEKLSRCGLGVSRRDRSHAARSAGIRQYSPRRSRFNNYLVATNG